MPVHRGFAVVVPADYDVIAILAHHSALFPTLVAFASLYALTRPVRGIATFCHLTAFSLRLSGVSNNYCCASTSGNSVLSRSVTIGARFDQQRVLLMGTHRSEG